ncbi:MAG: Holliday junction resolvase RuvX [bacterium]|nr:Holliday junction resolvase RuvX [bacterium]
MRVFAVDLGTVRMGFAVSDPLGLTAQPLETRPGGAMRQMCRTILEEIFEYEHAREENRVGTIVVGNALHLNGQSSEMSKRAQECVRLLRIYVRQHIPRKINVLLWDERLTSVQAENIMIEGGASRRTRRLKKDQVAAQLILEGYLDAQR